MDSYNFEIHESVTSQNQTNIQQFLNCNIGVHRILEIHYIEGTGEIEFITFDKSPSGNYSKSANKCIRLPLELFRVFLDNLEDILFHFEILKGGGETEYKLHLGQLYFIRIDKKVRCIDWRKHFIPVGLEPKPSNLKPGFPGIGMKIGEFDNFISLTKQLASLSLIEHIIPCRDRADHKNPHVIETCKNCNPNRIFF